MLVEWLAMLRLWHNRTRVSACCVRARAVLVPTCAPYNLAVRARALVLRASSQNLHVPNLFALPVCGHTAAITTGVAQYDLISYDVVTTSAVQSISSAAVTQAGGMTVMDFTIPLAAVAPSTRAILADGNTAQSHIWAYTDGDNK